MSTRGVRYEGRDPASPVTHLLRSTFIEGLSPQLQTQATVDAVSDHPERQLLSYVFGKFKESRRGLMACWFASHARIRAHRTNEAQGSPDMRG